MLKIVIGLPGCGKTTYMNELAAQGFRTFDDFHANAHGDCSDVEMSQHYFALMDALMADENCAIADTGFCEPVRRSAVHKAIITRLPRQPIEWIYFEHSPEKCRRNLVRRNHPTLDRELKSLEDFSPKYLIPAGAHVLPVHSED